MTVFDINKALIKSFSHIYYNDENNIEFLHNNNELNILYQNIKVKFSKNKTINKDNIQDEILKTEEYSNFIKQQFTMYFINSFNITNNDLNLITYNYINNVFQSLNIKHTKYYNINFQHSILNNKIINNDWTSICKLLSYEIFNNTQLPINITLIYNIITNKTYNSNYTKIIYGLALSQLYHHIYTLNNLQFVDFFIHFINIMLTNSKHHLQINSIDYTNYLELLNTSKQPNICEKINQFIEQIINNEDDTLINKIFNSKYSNILDKPLAYIQTIKTQWKIIYNYDISSFKLYQIMINNINNDFNQFNTLFNNNLYTNPLFSLIKHLFANKFNRDINLYELSKYYQSFLFIIYNNLSKEQLFKYMNNNLDTNNEEFNNFSNNKYINNYYNYNQSEFTNIPIHTEKILDNKKITENDTKNTAILADNDDISDKHINEINNELKEYNTQQKINKYSTNIIEQNINNINIIYQSIDYNQNLIIELSNFIENIYNIQETTFNQINKIYKEYLLIELDLNTYYNKYLYIIENNNYKSIFIDRFINSSIYKHNIYKLIEKVFIEYYELTLDQNDTEYLFNIIYNKKLPSIETNDLRDIISKFKLDTDNHYDITLKVYNKILERQPDINEVYYYKHLFRNNDDLEKSTTILHDNLYDNIEYNEILKKHIKNIYKKIKNNDILPSILYKILNSISNDNEIKKDITLIEKYIRQLDNISFSI